MQWFSVILTGKGPPLSCVVLGVCQQRQLTTNTLFIENMLTHHVDGAAYIDTSLETVPDVRSRIWHRMTWRWRNNINFLKICTKNSWSFNQTWQYKTNNNNQNHHFFWQEKDRLKRLQILCFIYALSVYWIVQKKMDFFFLFGKIIDYPSKECMYKLAKRKHTLHHEKTANSTRTSFLKLLLTEVF